MHNKIIIKGKNKRTFIVPNLLFKKMHKNCLATRMFKLNVVSLGSNALGVKALESAKITPKQNESIRRLLVKKFKETSVSTMHSLIPTWPVSKKAMGIRMGKGKGTVNYWIHRLIAGKISLQITIPHVLEENVTFLKHNYNNISKRFNYNSKLIINKHFIQEKYNNITEIINYWKPTSLKI